LTAQATRRYGVLLPHFGENASRGRIVDTAKLAEHYGFDSVWVRDHLTYKAHPWESQDLTFLDPFVVMSGVVACTERLVVGTAALIPHRHPILSALLLASLDRLAGPGRIIAGWSLGAYDHEFAAVGMKGWDRREVIEEHVAVIKKLWTGKRVTHNGKYYSFDDIEVHPAPPPGSIQTWYAGTSPASVRRAVEYCDGWGTTILPLRDYRSRIERMTRLAQQAGKPVPVAGVSAWVSPGLTVEEGARMINLERFLREAQHLVERKEYTPNASGRFDSIEDLDGTVLCGPPDLIVEGIRKYQDAGAEHFVFDMRNRFDQWDEVLRFVGEDVLPLLRRGDVSEPNATAGGSVPVRADRER
jgi:alkanesulfonate monooxygenase SsuD/methylene tetrahydromethanopterin reductase-like flavin-dependent oxidoreductase (luciferase family)